MQIKLRLKEGFGHMLRPTSVKEKGEDKKEVMCQG